MDIDKLLLAVEQLQEYVRSEFKRSCSIEEKLSLYSKVKHIIKDDYELPNLNTFESIKATAIVNGSVIQSNHIFLWFAV